MSEVTVTLDESLRQFVNDEVAQGNYASASAFVEQLLREAQHQKQRRRVDQRLLEGLKTERADLTSEDWNELQRRAKERDSQRSLS